MRIGIDVDGVLADFNGRFIERIISVVGKDLFPPRPFDIPMWQYPTHYGYTKEEETKVWEHIFADPTFWSSLDPYWYTPTVLEKVRELSSEHDVYFVTSRPGIRSKHQTEVWLATHSGDFLWNPTVLVSSEKAECAHALKLDFYIDDYINNCIATAQVTGPYRTFMLDQPWNRVLDAGDFGIVRVQSVDDMLTTVTSFDTRVAK